jgi:mRNA turnover protein 4
MAKALGTTPEEEHRLGLSKLATYVLFFILFSHNSKTIYDPMQQIKGQVGLFFTDTKPQEVIDWFADFQQPDFARAGNTATRTVNTTRRTHHETFFGPSRTVSSQ